MRRVEIMLFLFLAPTSKNISIEQYTGAIIADIPTLLTRRVKVCASLQYCLYILVDGKKKKDRHSYTSQLVVRMHDLINRNNISRRIEKINMKYYFLVLRISMIQLSLFTVLRVLYIYFACCQDYSS